MRSARRALATLLTPALLGGAAAGFALPALLGPAAPAAAATRPCVAVVVDGRLAGGSVRTGCATGDPRSGLDALTEAGFTYAFVPRQPGEVCQVDGFPQCGDTTTQTYWSYWWRAKGSSRWVYATEGAGTHDPAPGSTEAWVWQDGGRRQPPDIGFAAVCPRADASPEPSRTARATRAARAASTAKQTATPTRARPGSSAAASRVSPSAPTTTPSPPPSTGSAAASEATTSAAGAAAAPREGTASSRGGDGNGHVAWPPMALGAGAVALLGGAALWRGRRGRP